MRQMGRFTADSVYVLLASHMLSVLNKFHPLNGLVFDRQD